MVEASVYTKTSLKLPRAPDAFAPQSLPLPSRTHPQNCKFSLLHQFPTSYLTSAEHIDGSAAGSSQTAILNQLYILNSSILGEKQAILGDGNGPRTRTQNHFLWLRNLRHNIFILSKFLCPERIESLKPDFSFSLHLVHTLFFRKPRNFCHQVPASIICRAPLSSKVTVDNFNRFEERWFLSPDVKSLFQHSCMLNPLTSIIMLRIAGGLRIEQRRLLHLEHHHLLYLNVSTILMIGSFVLLRQLLLLFPPRGKLHCRTKHMAMVTKRYPLFSGVAEVVHGARPQHVMAFVYHPALTPHTVWSVAQ